MQIEKSLSWHCYGCFYNVMILILAVLHCLQMSGKPKLWKVKEREIITRIICFQYTLLGVTALNFSPDVLTFVFGFRLNGLFFPVVRIVESPLGV